MKKSQKQAIILIILLICFGLIQARAVGKKKFAFFIRERVESLETQVEAVPKAPEVSPIEHRVIEYKGAGYRGLFELPSILKARLFKKPVPEPVAGPAEEILPDFTVTVTGTVWGTDNPVAIIDGEICCVGDRVKEAEILQIDKHGVLFLYHGKTIRVEVQRP